MACGLNAASRRQKWASRCRDGVQRIHDRMEKGIEEDASAVPQAHEKSGAPC